MKAETTDQRRRLVNYVVDAHGAERAASLPPLKLDDGEIAERKPHWSFGKIFQRLRNLSCDLNHRRMLRVYRAQPLNRRVKPRGQLLNRLPTLLKQPEVTNGSSSVDSMSDSLQSGLAGLVVRVLDTIAAWRRYPRRLRSDSGPTIISQYLGCRAEKYDMLLDFTEPSSLAEIAYIERFNRTSREEILRRPDCYLFTTWPKPEK